MLDVRSLLWVSEEKPSDDDGQPNPRMKCGGEFRIYINLQSLSWISFINSTVAMWSDKEVVTQIHLFSYLLS